MTPRLGYFRTDTLSHGPATAPCHSMRLYLALLPDGRFLRTLGPAEGFDFAAYVAGAMTERSRAAGRPWSHFHHLGEYRVDGLTVTFVARMLLGRAVHVQRWSAGCIAPEILLARGDVYRLYRPGEVSGGGSSCE